MAAKSIETMPMRNAWGIIQSPMSEYMTGSRSTPEIEKSPPCSGRISFQVMTASSDGREAPRLAATVSRGSGSAREIVISPAPVRPVSISISSSVT